MLTLVTTTQKLRLITSAAGSIDFVAPYAVADNTTPPAVVTSGLAHGNIPTATTTDIVGAPAANKTHGIEECSFTNVHASVANTLTALLDDNGTARRLHKATLQTDEALKYANGRWFVCGPDGVEKQPVSVTPTAFADMSSIFSTAALTGTKSITTGNTFALYMGKAPRTFSPGATLRMRFRVTTLAATITWAECAVATGVPDFNGGNPSLTVRGYADVAAVVNTTGIKTVSISVSSGQSIAAGDDVWLLIGNAATTVAIIRAQTMADDIQAGFIASAASRPSTNVGVAVAYALESAVALPGWIAIAWG